MKQVKQDKELRGDRSTFYTSQPSLRSSESIGVHTQKYDVGELKILGIVTRPNNHAKTLIRHQSLLSE